MLFISVNDDLCKSIVKGFGREINRALKTAVAGHTNYENLVINDNRVGTVIAISYPDLENDVKIAMNIPTKESFRSVVSSGIPIICFIATGNLGTTPLLCIPNPFLVKGISTEKPLGRKGMRMIKKLNRNAIKLLNNKMTYSDLSSYKKEIIGKLGGCEIDFK